MEFVRRFFWATEKSLKAQNPFVDFVLKQWLLILSAIGWVLTSIYTLNFPVYSKQEIEVLFILFVLFMSVKGLQDSGLILTIAQKMEKGKTIVAKLVLATFFLSMLVTNDVAVLVMVPLTLSLNINRKGVVVILEALAANAGSASTPFGNPQNLFIYWYYQLHPLVFIETIAPFALTFLVVLVLFSLCVKISNIKQKTVGQQIDKKAYVFGGSLLIVLLTILHILPLVYGVVVVACALVFNRKAFLVDYALLVSFFFFFGIAENMKLILATELSHSGHVFLFSGLASQVMSNVPAALLFAKFTTNWQALLWGVNAGGFGSLFGSLANLIVYKIYVMDRGTVDTWRFTAWFLMAGYTAFVFSIGLYYFIYHVLGF